MIRQPVTISLETYTSILDKENLGEPHVTLLGAERWYSSDAEWDRSRRALDELRSQGLAAGNRVSEEFHDTLVVIQRPAVEYYSLVSAGSRASTVRTAMIGHDAILIESHPDSLTISPIPREQLGVRLAAALPETPPARVKSMNCDGADLAKVEQDKQVASDDSGRDAKRMQRVLNGSTDAGQLYAAVRDGVTGRKATRSPVPCWIDTESGRVLLSQDAGGWFTLVGADLMTLTGKLSDLENALRAQ